MIRFQVPVSCSGLPPVVADGVSLSGRSTHARNSSSKEA
jgi:hypothetical protein